MTLLTVLTVLVVAIGVWGRWGYGHALAIGGATAAGAAVTVAGTAIPTFYAVAVGAAVSLSLATITRTGDHPRQPFPPGAILLIAFAMWSVLITIISPFLFDGTAIVTPEATRLTAGVLTTSNVAQIVYLVLGMGVVIFIARSRQAAPALVGTAVGLCIVLSGWRYLGQQFGVPFPENLFDNSPSFAFIQTAPGGAERFRGILSEPAGMATASLVAIAYMLPRSRDVVGWRRAGCLLVAIVAAYLGVVSTSGTFVIGGVILAVIAAGFGTAGFALQRFAPRWTWSVVGCVAALAAVWLAPIVVAFVRTTVDDKLVSSSYTDRSSLNGDSLLVFLDTFGIGVGVGSARASSIMPTLVSATGLVGAVLFCSAIGLLLIQGSKVREFRPVLWALVALLVVKVVSGPDLSDSSGVLWIALGLLSKAAALRREDPLPNHSGSDWARPHPRGEVPLRRGDSARITS